MAKKELPEIKEKHSNHARTVAFNKLETKEELQKDIQRMYSESSKDVEKIKDVNSKILASRVFYSMKRQVDEVQSEHSLKSMTKSQMEFFWENTYTHFERIKQLSK